MHFVKRGSFQVLDIDISEEQSKRHGNYLPNNIRCIICGPSNCGKTNVIITLLTHPKGLRFENVYLYSKSLHQSKYQILFEILRRVKGVGFFPFVDNSKIVNYEAIKPNSIFIFDDVICDKQDHIREYFCIGRHKAIDVFYLCQSYTRVPKHLIRDNVNFLILFKQDDINLKHIYEEHVGTDMSFNNFKEFCAQCWQDDYAFVVVDKTNKFGRYRKGFDRFLEWNSINSSAHNSKH